MDERARILVVEPSKRNLGVMVRRLVEHGFRVTTADCGPSAVAELHRVPVDHVEKRVRVTGMLIGERLIEADGVAPA